MSRFIGFMVVGPGEGDKYLKEVLDQWKDLVDDAVICQNNTDKKTQQIVKDTGFWTYQDDTEWGKYQWKIKDKLLGKVAGLKPDIILPLDADELYDKRFNREEAEKLANTPGQISWIFYFIDLWNDRLHFNPKLNFWNVRMYRYDTNFGMYIERKPLHCGLAPPVCYNYPTYTPFLIKHLGLMDPEDRKKKWDRYEKYDPDRKWKSDLYYNELRDGKPSPFNEERWMKRVTEEIATYPVKPRLLFKGMEQYVFRRQGRKEKKEWFINTRSYLPVCRGNRY